MDTLFLFFAVLKTLLPLSMSGTSVIFWAVASPAPFPLAISTIRTSSHSQIQPLNCRSFCCNFYSFSLWPPGEKQPLLPHCFSGLPLDSLTLFKQTNKKKRITMKLKIIVATRRKLGVTNVWHPVKSSYWALKRWQSQYLSKFLPVARGLFPGLQVMAPCSAPFDAPHMNYRQCFTGK